MRLLMPDAIEGDTASGEVERTARDRERAAAQFETAGDLRRVPLPRIVSVPSSSASMPRPRTDTRPRVVTVRS